MGISWFVYICETNTLCKMLYSYTVCMQNICIDSSNKTVRDVWETTKYNKIPTVIVSVEFILRDRSTVQDCNNTKDLEDFAWF